MQAHRNRSTPKVYAFHLNSSSVWIKCMKALEMKRNADCDYRERRTTGGYVFAGVCSGGGDTPARKKYKGAPTPLSPQPCPPPPVRTRTGYPLLCPYSAPSPSQDQERILPTQPLQPGPGPGTLTPPLPARTRTGYPYPTLSARTRTAPPLPAGNATDRIRRGQYAFCVFMQDSLVCKWFLTLSFISQRRCDCNLFNYKPEN